MPVKINGSTSGSTTITAPATGTDETIELSTALAAKAATSAIKVVQIVRATDTTDRSTTSTSMTDTGLSVTITPTSASNSILLIGTGSYENASTTNNTIVIYAITNNSNTIVQGAWTKVGTANFTTSGTAYLTGYVTLVGYSSPATTSATTYKMRFLSEVSTTTNKLVNSSGTAGQLYAIEVA